MFLLPWLLLQTGYSNDDRRGGIHPKPFWDSEEPAYLRPVIRKSESGTLKDRFVRVQVNPEASEVPPKILRKSARAARSQPECGRVPPDE